MYRRSSDSCPGDHLGSRSSETCPRRVSVIRNMLCHHKVSVIRNMPSHEDYSDLAMLGLPGQAVYRLVHGPHCLRWRGRAPLAAMLRHRHQLLHFGYDEAIPSLLSAASQYQAKLGTSRHTINPHISQYCHFDPAHPSSTH